MNPPVNHPNAHVARLRVLRARADDEMWTVPDFGGPFEPLSEADILDAIDRLRGDSRATIDLAARTVSVDGREVALSRREWELCSLLAGMGRWYPREEILLRLFRGCGSSTTVSSLVHRTRQKTGRDAIENATNRGWRWRGGVRR